MQIKRQNISGFTLVEVLIAAGVLSLFLTGLISFYRMGSRMFVTGSWKQQKQKECERFLTILKERIEQASNASRIKPSGTDQLKISKSNFVFPNDGQVLQNPANDTRLMLFSVCKPDMSLLGQGPGLILYHCLMAKKAEKNLYTILLHANTDRVAHNGTDYFNPPADVDFFPNPADFTAPPANFNGNPSVYSLGGAPYTAKLTDVLSTSFTVELASGTNPLTDGEKVVGISITMQHPRYEQTQVSHRIKAKIDYSVPLDTRNLGDF